MNESNSRTKLRKKPELIDHLQVDNYIDVYCTHSKTWRVARIVDARDKEIEVNYDGTAKKLNESFKVTSSKLAFCRRFTQSYTGDDYRNSKTSRDYLKYSNELCRKYTQELKDIISRSFDGMSPLEISQSIRVRQFIYLDLVLSQECTDDELPVALDYIKSWFQFITWYFSIFPQYYSDSVRGHTNQELFLQDERVSIALCFQEVCEAFCMLFGSIWRVLKTDNSFLYINFNSVSGLIEQYFPPVPPIFQQNPNISDWNLYQGATDLVKCIKKTWPLYLRWMAYFDSIGGFNAWHNLLKPQTQIEGINQLPLKVLSRYFLTQSYLIQYYVPSDQMNIASERLDYLKRRVDTLKDIEIKDAEIDTIRDVISEHSFLFKKHFTQEELDKFIDQWQLTIALKFLMSPYLEKRVKGITEIRDVIEKVDPSISYKGTKVITKEQLIRWIKDNKILELILLGDSIHPELVKRCSEIAVFLTKNNAFHIDLIEKIWHANLGKHETTQLAIYDLFKNLSQHLSSEGMDRMYALIAAIPMSEYNENTVSLVHQFTENALNRKNNDGKKFYGFTQLWELLIDREENTVPHQIQTQAFQSARQIVSNIMLSKYFLQTFFNKCFELIRDHTSVYQAISFAHYILDKQFTEEVSSKKQLLKATNEKYQIIELFVRDIEVYLEKARSFFKDKPTSDVTISGVQTFQQNMFFRLQMLNYLLNTPEIIKITHDQLLRLWDCITVKTKGSIQKKELIKVLLQGTSENVQTRFFSDKDSLQKFFSQTLCNPSACDYPNFIQEEFDLFQVFFRTQNLQKNTIKILNGYPGQQSGKIVVRDFQRLEGIEALWEIFKVVKDPKVLESISNLLVTLYTSFLSSIDRQQLQNHQRQLMDRCLQQLQQSNSSAQLTSRCINLILQLFNVFQSGSFTSTVKKNPQKNTSPVSFKAVVQTEGQNNKTVEFKESESTTLESWKRKVADSYSVGYKQIELELDGKRIEEEYDLSLQHLGKWIPMKKVIIIIYSSYHPKNYLSQNQNTFGLLFDLLKQPNQTVQFQNQVWELINKLPTNTDQRDSIKHFKNSWNSFFQDSFYRQLYGVQIVRDLTKEDPTWQTKFLDNGGLQLLLKGFLAHKCNFVLNPLEKKSILCYLQLLNIYPSKSDSKQELQNKIISVIDALCDDLRQRDPEVKKTKLTSEVKALQELERDMLKEALKSLKTHFQAGLNAFFNADQQTLIRRLQTLLVDNDNGLLKKDLVDDLIRYQYDTQILLTLLTGPILQWVVDGYKQKSEQFWELVSELIRKESERNLTNYGIIFDVLTQNLVTSLKELKVFEITKSDQDQVLIGLLRLLQVLVEKYVPLKQVAGQKYGLMNEIFKCLIEKGQLSSQQVSTPKCKSSMSRFAAFQCLAALLGEQTNMQQFYSWIQPLHLTNMWRSKHFQDWNIQSKFNDKSQTGYVGLYNLGCICYMNSLLQQLFMIPQFREPLLDCENSSFGTTSNEDNVLFQLKCLFLALKHSSKQYHNPKKFCHAFKDFSGNPTNIFEQMDVDEFCNLLMDRIEASIKGTESADLVKRNFGGVISHEIICKGCPHLSEREEPFFALSLAVKNKKTIEQCLQAMINGDLLEGDNAYYCEQCQKKVNAVKRMCLKKLPNQLIVVLKRFDFDFDLMTKAKINDRCEFPFKLDLQQYSQQGLRKSENRAKGEEPDMPSEYFEYRLTGVVIHMGSADSGHYYSFIQEREKQVAEDKKWYEFNDTFVQYIDQKEITTEGYGGDKISGSKIKMIQPVKDKSKNAYLLFYERIQPVQDIPAHVQQPKQEEKHNQQSLQQSEISESQIIVPSDGNEEKLQLENFLNEINEENEKYSIQRLIFNTEYFGFITQLITQQDQLTTPDPSLVKVALVFFFTCAVRESERSWMGANISGIKSILSKSIPSCQWLMTAFTQTAYIREFQLECPIKNVRKYVITLLETAIQTVSKSEGYQKIYEVKDDQPASTIAALINQWILCIRDIRGSARQYAEFFDLFYRFAKISQEYTNYLLSKRMVGRLLDFYIENFCPNNQSKKLVNQEEVRRNDDIRLLTGTFNFNEYFGTQSQQQVEASSHYDDLVEKKLEKNFSMQLTQTKQYLWRLVAHLIESCKLNPSQKGHTLTSDETELLIQDGPFFQCLLEEGDCKLAIRQIAKIFCQIALDNQKLSDVLISSIHKAIHDKEHKEYRKYFVVLKKILLLKDQYQDFRISFAFNQLFLLMQKQTQFFFETDICQQYIIRMVAKNQRLREWMSSHLKSWNWFVENISNQQTPNEKLMQHNFNQSKTQHRLHGLYQPTVAAAYKKHFIWKKTVFNQLYKNEIPSIPTSEYDSDDDLSNYPIKVGEKVDFYAVEQNMWVSASIDKVMEDYVQLSYVTTKLQTITIERDSEKLAPHQSLSFCNKVPGTNQAQLSKGYTETQSAIQYQPNPATENDNDTEEGNYNSHASSESEDN